jgi:hypothetical protein
MKFSIFRFNPEQDKNPYMQDYEIELVSTDQIRLRSGNPAVKGCAVLTP